MQLIAKKRTLLAFFEICQPKVNVSPLIRSHLKRKSQKLFLFLFVFLSLFSALGEKKSTSRRSICFFFLPFFPAKCQHFIFLISSSSSGVQNHELLSFAAIKKGGDAREEYDFSGIEIKKKKIFPLKTLYS